VETKPFTIQSPEQIAKDYGGNKQKIAEAMQMGIVDPTAGTLAGMFIDRMRSAAQAEGAPQQTVAEQVFSPTAPPMGAPMGAPEMPMGAPAGLGATPEAAAMPPQEMGMGPPPQEMAPPQEMPMEEAPMGMAEGGLTTLPVPDTMFDEPDNGSYAGGGMVAFAAGASVPKETDGQRFERIVTKYIPGTIVTSRQRSVERNKQVGGVRNSFHIPDRARDFVPPKGMSLTEFGARVKAIPELAGTDAVFNSPGHHDHLHLEPGPGGKSAGGEELIADAKGDKTVYGLPTNLPGSIDFIKSLMPAQSEEDIEYRKELEENLSPENRKRDKKDAFFEGLGKLGARLGASKNPSFLGSLAETLGPGAADIAESLDEDKKRIREMQRERSQLANLTRKEEIEAIGMGVDLNKTAANINESIAARKEEVAYKNALLVIERAKVGNQLAQILAESQGKENTKEKFIETFYNVLIRKGYSENQARQFAYIAAERQLAKLKAEYPSGGGTDGLFDKEETGGASNQTGTSLDYNKDLK
jgi:hypothetical protein